MTFSKNNCSKNKPTDYVFYFLNNHLALVSNHVQKKGFSPISNIPSDFKKQRSGFWEI